jgi:tellurium resistance protein TerZ
VVTIPLSLVVEEAAAGNKLEREFLVEKCQGASEAKLGSLSVSISYDPMVPVAMSAGDVVDVAQDVVVVGLQWQVDPSKKQKMIINSRDNHNNSNNNSQIADKNANHIDLDASAVIFDRDGRLMEAIYFDQLISTDIIGKDAIIHHGDARETGKSGLFDEDDERIQINLSKLNSEVLAIFICVCAFSDGSTFQDVIDANCRVYDNSGMSLFECCLGKLGLRTSVTMVRIFRDSVGGGWKMGSLFTADSCSRSWGFLIPHFKDNLGTDLVPGSKGKKSDRIAIMSKGQSFQIADTCDKMPDQFCVGLHWDITEGKNIDLDAGVLLLNDDLKLLDYVSYDHLNTQNLAVRHLGDEQEGDEVGDDERVIIDFSKLADNVQYMCVIINSYSGQELDDVKDAGCHIFGTDDPTRDICKIKLSGEKSMDGKTACLVACFFKVSNAWFIKSVNQVWFLYI